MMRCECDKTDINFGMSIVTASIHNASVSCLILHSFYGLTRAAF